MPPTIGGKNFPYDRGQSGTARPDPVEVTIAPAKMRKSVDAATSFVKPRSQALSISRYRTGVVIYCTFGCSVIHFCRSALVSTKICPRIR